MSFFFEQYSRHTAGKKTFLQTEYSLSAQKIRILPYLFLPGFFSIYIKNHQALLMTRPEERRRLWVNSLLMPRNI
jgi:hypothetical protein